MNDLETLVRDTLRSRDHEAPDGANLLHDVRELAAHRRRGWAASALAAGATAAVVTAVAVLVPDGRQARPPVADTPPAVEATDVPTQTPTVPPDIQPVSYHGVEVLVPASWTIGATYCGTPIENTVIVHDGSAQCAAAMRQPPDLTVVHIAALDLSFGDERAKFATQEVTVSGKRALRGVGTLAGWQRELAVLVLPDPGVVVSVESPDPALAQRLLDMVRITPVDSAGCRDRVEMTAPPAVATRPGAAEQLVPGSPTSASICRYAYDWLARSAALTPTELQQLVGILNALPAGTSTAGPGYFKPPDDCAEDTQRGFIVQFGYDTGEPEDVHIQISGCAELSASNGARTTKVDDAVVTFLLDAVGYDAGFPDPRELR